MNSKLLALGKGLYGETMLFVNNVALKAKPNVMSFALLDMPKGRGTNRTKSTLRWKRGHVWMKHPMVKKYNDPSAALPIEQLTGQQATGQQSVGQQPAGQRGQAPAGQHSEQPVGHYVQQAATVQQSAGQQPVGQQAKQATVNN